MNNKPTVFDRLRDKPEDVEMIAEVISVNDTPKATLRRTHPFMVHYNRLGWDVYGEMSPDDSYEIDGEDLVWDEEA